MTIKPLGASPSTTARAALTSLARAARHVDQTTTSGTTALAHLRELDTLCTVGRGTMAMMSTFGGPRAAAIAPVDSPVIVDAMSHVAEPMGVMEAIIRQRSSTASMHNATSADGVDVTPIIWQNSHLVEAPTHYGFRQLASHLDDNGDPIAPRFEVPTPGVHVHRFAEVSGAVVEVHDKVVIEESRSISAPISLGRGWDELQTTESQGPFGTDVEQPFGAKRIHVERSFVVEAEAGKNVELSNVDSGERLTIPAGTRAHFDHLDPGAWRLTVTDNVDQDAESQTSTITMPAAEPRAEILYGGFGAELIDTNGNTLKPRLVDSQVERRKKSEHARTRPIIDGQNDIQIFTDTVVYEDPRLSSDADHRWRPLLNWKEHPMRADGLFDGRWPNALDDVEVNVVRYESGSLELQIDGESFFLAPIDNEERGLDPDRSQTDFYSGYAKLDGQIYEVNYRYESDVSLREFSPLHILRFELLEGDTSTPAQMHGIGGQ